MTLSVSETDYGLAGIYGDPYAADEAAQLAIESKQQRERIATAALQGLAERVRDLTSEGIAVLAVRLADALITELNKKEKENEL
jgi:hypothetical protein